MASTDAAKKALATTKPGAAPDATVQALIKSLEPDIAKALPKHMDPERMGRIALTLVRQIPDLARCSPQSFIGALMTCAQLGLEPGVLGLAWIIPRRNREGVWEAGFQLGYKGAIELARRSGKLAKITARTVYEREVEAGQFTVEYDGAEEHIRHVPILIGERGKPVLYYAVAKLTSGEEIFTALTPGDVETRHRRRPQAQPDSPAWKNDYEAMAHKSCVVEMRRWLPQSPELEQAVAQEGRVRTDIAREAIEQALPADFVDSTAEEITDQAAVVETSAGAGAGSDPQPPGGTTGTGWPDVTQPADATREANS